MADSHRDHPPLPMAFLLALLDEDLVPAGEPALDPDEQQAEVLRPTG